MSRNENVKINIYHMSQIILKDKIGGRFCHIFPMGCCKSVQYDSKGCCSNNMLFLMLVLVMGFLFVILGKKSKNETAKINIYRMSQVIPKDRWGICSHFFEYGML